jgi:hypothetical protein
LEQVVRWAESIRSEGAAIEAEASDLRKLGPRSGTARGTTTAAAATRRKQERQSKLQELDTRRQRQTMNQALLEGILAGGVSLDVQEGGELRFLHAQGHAATDVAGPATA